VTDHDDDGRRYRGKVTTPVKRSLDLEDWPESDRLGMVARRAAQRYDDLGLVALPGLLRRVALELDVERHAAYDLLAPTATERTP
jgi:hypothetical protein